MTFCELISHFVIGRFSIISPSATHFSNELLMSDRPLSHLSPSLPPPRPSVMTSLIKIRCMAQRENLVYCRHCRFQLRMQRVRG